MVSPSIRMVTLRRSAKNIPVPSALDARQRSRQGIQWILKAAERGRAGGQPRNGRLAREIMSVLEGTSAALQRKDEVHRLATVNRSVSRRSLTDSSLTLGLRAGRICRRDDQPRNITSLAYLYSSFCSMGSNTSCFAHFENSLRWSIIMMVIHEEGLRSSRGVLTTISRPLDDM